MAFDPNSATLDTETPDSFDPSSAAPVNLARATIYTRFDDGPTYYDGRTAVANPLTGKALAQEGVTIAVDPAVIPYGSKVRIPALAGMSANGDGIFIAHDTGSAVKSRKASGGKEPVIDIFVDGADEKQAKARRDALAKGLGTDPLDYEIVEAGDETPFDPTTAKPDKSDPLQYIANALERGSLQSDLAMEMQKEQPRATTVAAYNRLTSDVPASPEMERFNGSKTTGEALRAFIDAPLQITAELTAESLASFLKTGAQKIPQRVIQGGVMGGMAGTMIPGAGTVAGTNAGARAGFVTGTGETSFALESSGKILEALGDAGVNLRDDKSLKAAFANTDQMAKARELATRKGVPIAIFDGVSALIGGRLFTKPAKTISGKLLHGAAELGTQAAMGMGGEVAGELTAGEKLQPAAILAEGLGELGPGSVEIAAGLATREAPATTTPAAFDPSTAEIDEEPAPSADADTTGAPSLFTELTAEAEAPTPAPPVLTTAATPTAEAAGTETPQPVGPNASSAQIGSVPDEDKTRLVRDFSFPAGLVNYLTPAEAAPLLRSQPGTRQGEGVLQQTMRMANQRYDAANPRATAVTTSPASSGLNARERTILDARRAQRVAQEERAAAEAAAIADPATEADIDIPFAKQPGTPEAKEEARLQGIVRDQWRAIGERNGPKVVTVKDATDIPDDLGGKEVRSVVKDGNAVVEAYFLPERTKRDGTVIPRQIVIVQTGAAQIAEERNIPLEQRVRQLALHELVHHYGSLTALFPDNAKARREYNTIVDGLLTRLAKTDADLLAWLTKPTEEGGYGFDLNDAAGRAAAAEEYLARQHESAKGVPGWVRQKIAELKQLFRRLFPNIPWTDNDVRVLLDAARRRAADSRALAPAEVKMSAQPSEDSPSIAALLKAYAESDQAWRYPRELTARTPEKIAEQISVPGREVYGEASRRGDLIRFRNALGQLDMVRDQNGAWEIYAPLAGSAGIEEGGGSQLYQAAFAWAHNNGVTVKPSGTLTDINRIRRTSNMLSSALRFDTTRHLYPDPDQRLTSWTRSMSNHDANIEALAEREAEYVIAAFPELADLTIDPETLSLLDTNGQPVPNSEIYRIIEDRDPRYEQGVGIGTAKRAVFFRSAAVLPGHRERSGKLGKRLLRDADRGGLKPLLYSAQEATTPEQRRQFIDKVKRAPQTQPIARQVESLYQPLGDKEAIAAAKDRINTIGLDAAEREILAIDPKSNPPTKWTNVLAIELMGRLAASGEYAREAAIAVKIAEGNTSQAQAIQSMAIFQRMSSGGIQAYAANVVEKAVKTGGFSADTRELYDRIKKLNAELEKLRTTAASGAVLDVEKMLEAAGFTGEKLADIKQKLRQALLIATVQPGNAEAKITGLLVAAGMERKAATKLAGKAVGEIKRRTQRARDRILRDMLQVKRGMPDTPALDQAIQSQLRQTMQAHGEAVWTRYRRSAAQALGNAAARLADPAERVRTPALQDFTARLLNTLKSQLPAEQQPKSERDGIALLAEAVNNADKYRAVWDEARRFVADKYRGNPQMLDRLDRLIGHHLTQPFSQTTLQNAIEDGLAEFETSVRDLLTRSHLDKAIAKTQLVSLIADRIGVRGAEAERVGAAILQRWNVAEAKAREAYAAGLFKDPIAKVSKGELAKWIEMNNAGLLDDPTFLAQISAKYGLPVFTSREATQIAELQRRFEQAAEGDAKLVAGARMMDAIHSLVPASMWGKVNAIRTMAMLFNPKTIIRNVIGNQVMFVTDVTADALNGWAVDPLVSLVTGQRARTSGNVAARLNGLAQPWRDFWAGVEQGRQEGRTGRMELFASGIAYLRDLGRLTQAGIWDTASFTKTFRHTFSSRTGQLFEDGLAVALGAFDRAFHASAFQGSLANQMAVANANGAAVLAPTPEILERALIDANRAIFQDENIVSRVLKETKRALNYASWQTFAQLAAGEKPTPGDFGLGSLLIPFAQVPGSILTRGVEFSPAGFIRASYELLSPMLGRTKPFDQRAFANAFARATTGSVGWLLGAWLLKLGILSALPDDDKDLEDMRRSQGLGGLKINVSELWRRMLSGNFATPATMNEAAQPGDLTMNYDWMQPAAFMLAAGAQYQQERQTFTSDAERGKIARTGSAFMAGLLGAAQSTERMSVVRNLQMLATDVGREKGFAVPIANQIATMGASFVPTVIKDLGTLFDPLQRESRENFARHPADAAINAITSRLPGLSSNFPPRYDVLGVAQERYQYPGARLFQAFVSPAFLSQVRKEPVLQELERIFLTTGQGEATPSARTRTVTINDRQRELTNEELASYKYFTGRVAAAQLQVYFASPNWARLPANVQVRYVAGAFSDAAAAGKVLLFGDRPDRVERGLIKAAIIGKRTGATQRPNE